MRKTLVILVAIALLGTAATYFEPGTHKAVSKTNIAQGSTATTTSSGNQTSTPPTTSNAPTDTTAASSYKDGTYHGQDVSFDYGDIAVAVVIKNGKITNVNFDQLNPSSGHSQEIDSFATPTLVSQTIASQTANIDGVSGASLTTSAYEQSLQAALDQAKA